MPNFALCDTSIQLEEWAKFRSQYLEQLSTFSTQNLDFRHVAPLRNRSASKATVENRGQNLHFKF